MVAAGLSHGVRGGGGRSMTRQHTAVVDGERAQQRRRGSWRLERCCLAMRWRAWLHAPSGVAWREEAAKREAAREWQAGSAAGRGRATYRWLCAGCGCGGRRARAPWRLRRAADGLKRNLELLPCDGLALKRVVGAHGLAYGAVLHQRRARHVVEAEALDGAVQLRARGGEVSHED